MSGSPLKNLITISVLFLLPFMMKGQGLSVKRTIDLTQFLPDKADFRGVVQNKETGNLHFLGVKGKKEFILVEYDPASEKVVNTNTITGIKPGITAAPLPNGQGIYAMKDLNYRKLLTGAYTIQFAAWDLKGQETEFDDRIFYKTNEKNEYYTVREISRSTTQFVTTINNTVDIHDASTKTVKQSWMPPDLEAVRYQPIGTQPAKLVKSGMSSGTVPYSQYSPWGRPILVVANWVNLLIYDAETKKLLQRVRLSDKSSCDYFGTKVLTNGIYAVELSQLGNYAYVYGTFPDFSKKKRRYGFKVINLKTGDVEYSAYKSQIPFGRINQNYELLGLTNDSFKSGEVIVYDMPGYLRDEVEYLNWLDAAEAKKDSIALMAKTFTPRQQLNSPNNDWVYLGDQGVNGMADGIGDAIRKDGLRFIKDGLFIGGEFVAGKMENVYEVTMEGEFRDMTLNGFGRHVTENKTILEGTFVDGRLDGQGESIDPTGLRYVGEFKKGAFEGKGKITRPDGEMYDGEFLAGRPHGNGIYKDGSAVERVEYYEGERIDQAYLIRKENERQERQRQLEQLQEQQRAKELARQQQRKSSNRLFGSLAAGLGAGLIGADMGMDAMQAMEFGTAMFQDVMSGGTSNLSSLSNQWEADFQAKRVQYDTYSSDYAKKYYSSVEESEEAAIARNPNFKSEEQIAREKAQGQQEYQERQRRMQEMRDIQAQKRAEESKQQQEICQMNDPDCITCACMAIMGCNRGASNCSR